MIALRRRPGKVARRLIAKRRNFRYLVSCWEDNPRTTAKVLALVDSEYMQSWRERRGWAVP